MTIKRLGPNDTLRPNAHAIVRLRKIKNLSQDALASLAAEKGRNISVKSLQRSEKGVPVSRQTIDNVAATLEVSASEISYDDFSDPLIHSAEILNTVSFSALQSEHALRSRIISQHFLLRLAPLTRNVDDLSSDGEVSVWFESVSAAVNFPYFDGENFHDLFTRIIGSMELEAAAKRYDFFFRVGDVHVQPTKLISEFPIPSKQRLQLIAFLEFAE